MKLDLDRLTVETFTPAEISPNAAQQTPDVSALMGCTLYVTCSCNCHTVDYDCA